MEIQNVPKTEPGLGIGGYEQAHYWEARPVAVYPSEDLVAGAPSAKIQCRPNCRIAEFHLEVVKIRNRAYRALVVNNGLSLNQIGALRLSDVKLASKTLVVRSGNEAKPRHISLTDDTANLLAAYLRVRPPSKDNVLFLVQEASEE